MDMILIHIVKRTSQRKKDIGMIFQHFNLLNSKTVFKNVAMPLILSHKSNSEIKEKVEEMLEFVGLADKKNQFRMSFPEDKNNVLQLQEHL